MSADFSHTGLQPGDSLRQTGNRLNGFRCDPSLLTASAAKHFIRQQAPRVVSFKRSSSISIRPAVFKSIQLAVELLAQISSQTALDNSFKSIPRISRNPRKIASERASSSAQFRAFNESSDSIFSISSTYLVVSRSLAQRRLQRHRRNAPSCQIRSKARRSSTSCCAVNRTPADRSLKSRNARSRQRKQFDHARVHFSREIFVRPRAACRG